MPTLARPLKLTSQVNNPAILKDPAVTAYVAAVVAGGGTVSEARSVLLDALVNSLKSGGIWTQLDRLWVFAAENAEAALIDLKSLATATVATAPTFTADEGYAGNGTSSYVNSLFLPSAGTKTLLNTHHFSVYIRTSRTLANASAIGGCQTTVPSTVELAIYPRFTGNVIHMRSGDAAASAADQVNAQGFWLINRSGASAKQWYKNGSAFTSTTTAVVALPAFAMYFGAKNNSGTAGQFSSDQFSVVSVGGSLTATQVLAFKNAIETYMDALGKGVLS